MNIFLERKKIQKIITSIGSKLNKDFEDSEEPIILLCVLSGAAMFACDLSKRLKFPNKMIFTKAHSYEGTSQGEFVFDYWPDFDFNGKTVIIVDDIVDSGNTIRYISERILKSNEPKAIHICSLLKRKGSPCYVEYLGTQVEPGLWLYGYGMDYPDELNRNLFNIYIKE